MLSGETTFTEKEITDLLRGCGYTPGTTAFQRERARCFRPADGMPGCFVEVDAVRSLEAKQATGT